MRDACSALDVTEGARRPLGMPGLLIRECTNASCALYPYGVRFIFCT